MRWNDLALFTAQNWLSTSQVAIALLISHFALHMARLSQLLS